MTAAQLIPLDLSSGYGAAVAFLAATAIVALRYFLVALPAYAIFWREGAAIPQDRQLHDQHLPEGQIRREIGWSMVAAGIFGLAAVVMGYLWQQGYSLIYSAPDAGLGAAGYAYLPLSFVVYAAVHELYYYGSHRWMHHPAVYSVVHAVHHESRKTSPFASFSFHPYEALIQAAFIPLMVMVVPIHPAVLLAYLTFMTVTAVSNHLGVELIVSESIKKHFISGAHHDLHHKFMNVHFGLYFTATDRWWGTTLAARRRRTVAISATEQGDITR